MNPSGVTLLDTIKRLLARKNQLGPRTKQKQRTLEYGGKRQVILHAIFFSLLLGETESSWEAWETVDAPNPYNLMGNTTMRELERREAVAPHMKE